MQHGSLAIPDNAKFLNVEDEEFGKTFTVKSISPPNKVFLYAKPPEKHIRDLMKSGNILRTLFGRRAEIDLQPIGDSPYPAIIINRSQSAGLILVNGELPPGQHVIARVVPGHVGVYEVVTYKKKDDKRNDMPESGQGIEITGKGFVSASDLEPYKDIKDTFERFKGPIFPNANLIADIKQNIFGDCFLLSSILSILSKPGGAEYIRGMMRQENDFTIVRLFNPNTHQPVYIKVKNTELYQNGESTVTHGAPWVHILEKAYTALAYKPTEKGISAANIPSASDYAYSFPAFQEMYGSGGKPKLALRILTGNAAEERTIDELSVMPPWGNTLEILNLCSFYMRMMPVIDLFTQAELNELDAGLKRLTKTDETFLKDTARLLTTTNKASAAEKLQALSKIAAENTDRGRLITSVLKAIERIKPVSEQDKTNMLSGIASYLSEYNTNFINESPLGVSKVLNNVSLLGQMGEFIYSVQQCGQLSRFQKEIKPAGTSVGMVSSSYNAMCRFTFDQPKSPSGTVTRRIPPEVANVFTAYMKDSLSEGKVPWNGRLGGGFYAAKSLAIYDDIRRHVTDKFNLHTLVAASRDNFKDTDAPGLRSTHAYCIVDAYEKEVDKTHIKLKFIKLRNPWGCVGREYDWKNYEAPLSRSQPIFREREDTPEFEVELSDFIKYFYKYTIGELSVKLQPEDIVKTAHEQSTATTKKENASPLRTSMENLGFHSESAKKPQPPAGGINKQTLKKS